ncbi:1167_t:CDS:2 [Funneliformis caledonium]|uniref:1167_t:CDS:1 n=1 Tax=Funneliformis caledonium TaxID=1117310 RepID=A0A9N9N804_9GLOM|nr:1167_t:CDS:2 [Funneliformis caledonium]
MSNIIEVWKIHIIGGLSSCNALFRYYINIILIRWYKDDILIKLDNALENSSVLTAVKSTIPLTQVILQKNRFEVAFSITKTAINIALETESDNELVKLLKNFILIKQNNHNGINSKNNIGIESIESNDNNDNIISLQQHLINQTTDPNVTKIRGVLCKRRLKSAIERLKRRNPICEIIS